MPSKNEKERQSNNYTKSGQKRYHNQSANDDYLCDTDSDEKEEEETIDCEKKNNVRRNKYSSFEASEGKKMASVKYSNLKDKYRVTPESNSKDVETFHTDKYKSSHHNKNLEYLYKDSNPYQEEIIYNPRYPNNNPNYNLSYLYSSGISSNHYGNNNYGNQFNNTSIPTPYNYQQHNMNLQRPKMSQTTAKNDFIFPKNSIGGIDSSRHLNGGLYKDPLSCSYCEEFYKMALFQNVPLQLLSCPYCSNTLNQTSLQFYFRKYETELNESIKKNIEYPNEVSKQTTMSKSSKQPNSHNYPLNGTYECQNLSTYPTRNNLSTNEENRKEEYTNKDMKEAVEYESEHNNEEDNYRHNNYEEKLNKSKMKGKIAAILSIEKTGVPVPAFKFKISSTNASDDQWPQLMSVLNSISAKVSDAQFANRPVYAVPDFDRKRDIQEIREYRTIDFILPGQLGFSLLSTGVFGVAFVFFLD